MKDVNLSGWTRKDQKSKECRQDGDAEWIMIYPDGSYAGLDYQCRAVRVTGKARSYDLTLRCDGEESAWTETQKLELTDGILRSVRITSDLKQGR
jgi:hypothetical protein